MFRDAVNGALTFLEMERRVRDIADAKQLTIVRLALNDEIAGLSKRFAHLVHDGTARQRRIVEQVKLEKPR